jgi:hypothetical protein
MFLRALGDSGKSVQRQRLRGAEARIATGILALVFSCGLSACGGGQRQDVTEPAGNFPVQVTKAEFPNRQRLAQTSDLELAIKNAGGNTIPDLAVTIYTGDIKAGSSFDIRLDEPNLADPNRPVWILENQYPKLLTPTVTVKNLDRAPSAGAVTAKTDTFRFGAVEPGDSKDAVWRVTPVKAGTYTIHYEVAAGLEGKAKAVTRDGSPVKGEFVVTISDTPPQTCVNDAGRVATGCGP